jgi:uncharacterized protein
MSVIIDGYNLLYAVGVLGKGVGPHGLERARLALLNFLADSLQPADLPHTIVVFDAHDAPWGAPRTLHHRGLTVQFAVRYADADSLIEELIRHESAPRRLTVVSGDHRLQRAARRRRAAAVDSEAWYDEVVRARRQRHEAKNEPPDRPPVPLLQEDVNYWMRQFGGQALLEQLAEQELAAREGQGRAPHGNDRAGAKPDTASAAGEDLAECDEDRVAELPEIANPFPPGYAEDLLAEEAIEMPPRPAPTADGKRTQQP